MTDRILRKKRIRAKISGDATCPRIVVYRSNRKLYIQAIDDKKGMTLAAGNDSGKLLQKLQEKKIKKVVFDRAGYQYHGKIKKIAEDLRKAGLEF